MKHTGLALMLEELLWFLKEDEAGARSPAYKKN